MMQLTGLGPQCQVYDATGPDAASTIDTLRKQCVDQPTGTAKIVATCPTEDNLGGCKTPVKVRKAPSNDVDPNVSLTVTVFSYKPTGNATGLAPSTPDAAKQECLDQGDATYVPVP